MTDKILGLLFELMKPAALVVMVTMALLLVVLIWLLDAVSYL